MTYQLLAKETLDNLWTRLEPSIILSEDLRTLTVTVGNPIVHAPPDSWIDWRNFTDHRYDEQWLSLQKMWGVWRESWPPSSYGALVAVFGKVTADIHYLVPWMIFFGDVASDLADYPDWRERAQLAGNAWALMLDEMKRLRFLLGRMRYLQWSSGA